MKKVHVFVIVLLLVLSASLYGWLSEGSFFHKSTRAGIAAQEAYLVELLRIIRQDISGNISIHGCNDNTRYNLSDILFYYQSYLTNFKKNCVDIPENEVSQLCKKIRTKMEQMYHIPFNNSESLFNSELYGLAMAEKENTVQSLKGLLQDQLVRQCGENGGKAMPGHYRANPLVPLASGAR